MIAVLLVLGHTFFNTLGNICFKLSAESQLVWVFWLWQALGNFSTFTGVMSYTFSMRYLPLHIAYPVTQGLSVLSVTVVASRFVFRESLSLLHWLGIILVIGGILLIGLPGKGKELP